MKPEDDKPMDYVDEQVDALRTGYALKHALDERDKARKERDELLAACEAASRFLGSIALHHPHLFSQELDVQLGAAIDKAKGR